VPTKQVFYHESHPNPFYFYFSEKVLCFLYFSFFFFAFKFSFNSYLINKQFLLILKCSLVVVLQLQRTQCITVFEMMQ
jgi:hypothetical protein